MVVCLPDNLTPGSACVSRATSARLGLLASRQNELYGQRLHRHNKSPRYPRYCGAGLQISGEHRLPACKFRQPAETAARFSRLAGTPRCCRQMRARCPRSPDHQQKKSPRSRGRDRQHARRVRYPEEFAALANSYSPTLRCNNARAYSRLSLAMKPALISAGQTASHS